LIKVTKIKRIKRAKYRKLKNNKIKEIIRIKGYPTATKTFAFKKDAKIWVNNTERQMLLGTYTEISMLPIRELLCEYEKNVGQFKKAYDHGERYQYSALTEAFGNWDISKLTAKVIKSHLNTRMSKGLKGSECQTLYRTALKSL